MVIPRLCSINAVVPFEVAGRQQVSVQVIDDGANLPAVSVPVADAAGNLHA